MGFPAKFEYDLLIPFIKVSIPSRGLWVFPLKANHQAKGQIQEVSIPSRGLWVFPP